MRLALIISLIIYAFIFNAPSAHAHELKYDSLKIAIEDSWPPYADENGQGYSRDILEKALKYADIEYEIQVEPYTRALYLTEIGTTNACLNVTRQKSTEAIYYFGTEPLLYADAYFFVEANKDVHFKSLKDVPDQFNIGVIIGYEYGDIYEQEKHRFNLTEVRSQEQIIQMLHTGRIDGAIMFDEVYKYNIEQMALDENILKRVFLNQTSDIYVAFHKDDPESKYYADKLDAALKALRAEEAKINHSDD